MDSAQTMFEAFTLVDTHEITLLERFGYFKTAQIAF
jgi:hypothetical protein